MRNLLKEEVYKKMNELCDNPEQIIYKEHKTTSDALKMYIVIAKIPRFRLYKGLQYGSSISVEYFTINEDMYLSMTSTLKVNLGEM